MANTPPLFRWQRDYYEHVMRNEKDLERIREYIANNPARWDEDNENPAQSYP
jgi:putative transposase